MNPLLRASAIAALTLACLDGHAEVHRSCIRSLGVQAAESPKPTLSPKKTCLTAIVFAPQSPGVPGLHADLRAAARATVRPAFNRV